MSDLDLVPKNQRETHKQLAEIAATFLTDTLTELTRTRQKYLLTASTILILLCIAVIKGKEGQFYGIKFELTDASLVRPLAGTFTGYLLVTFCVSVYQDIKTRKYRSLKDRLVITETTDPLITGRTAFFANLNAINQKTAILEAERDRLLTEIAKMRDTNDDASEQQVELEDVLRKWKVAIAEFNRAATGIPGAISENTTIIFSNQIVATQSRLTLIRDAVDIVFPILLAVFAISFAIYRALYY